MKKIRSITLKNDKTIELILTNGMNLPVCLKKEKKFFDKFGIKGDALEYLLENDKFLTMFYKKIC